MHDGSLIQKRVGGQLSSRFHKKPGKPIRKSAAGWSLGWYLVAD